MVELKSLDDSLQKSLVTLCNNITNLLHDFGDIFHLPSDNRSSQPLVKEVLDGISVGKAINLGKRKFSELSRGDGLSFYTTEKALLDAFSQYGQVVEANIMMDKVSSRSKGFGFVMYASADEAEKAINEMDGQTLHGHVICVELAKPRSQHSSGVPIARGPPEPPTEQQ